MSELDAIYQDLAVYGSAFLRREGDTFVIVPHREIYKRSHDGWYRTLKAQNKRNKRMRRHAR